MNGALTIEQISTQVTKAAADLAGYCRSLTDEQFFYQPVGKWSPAQQVKHLITATHTAKLAFTLPKFIVRLIGGKPNRHSRTYDELVAKYKLKLEQGGKASRPYIPKPVPASYGKEKLLIRYSQSMQDFAGAVAKNWKEPLPDHYLAPHPLLGRVTLRELCYFTIYHTHHHLTAIRNLISNEKTRLLTSNY
ncbi:MAG: DinB family protein [Bacteroidetes bacterium]|nr:DinB family protein [Bacteroidota bacterium]